MRRHTRLLAAATLAFAATAFPATPDSRPDRDDPAALAKARNVLASRSDRQGRVRVLHEMRERDRLVWSPIADDIGLTAQDLEWLLAQRAQRQLVNEQREAHCWLDPACDPFAPIDGWVDPFDDLSSQLGRERFERYQLFITACDERAYLADLQRRMPSDDPLPDAVIEQLALALAQGRARFAEEARQQRFTVQARLLDQPTVHLWSGYHRGASDEYPQRKESAARYARWLQDVAARHLSVAQLADFRAMLDREMAAYDEWLPVDAIRQALSRAAIGPRRNDAASRPPRKDPGGMAQADFRLSDRSYQPSAAARFAANARSYWRERAAVTLLRLSPQEVDQMAQTLAELEFRQELVLLACITDPDCDSDALRVAHREARSAEAARILGPEEFAHFTRANGDDAQPYYRVRAFRDQLPEEHQLSDEQARRLAETLVAEEARPPARSDAPGAADDHARRMAAVDARVQRLHEAAAEILDREQLRQFDAMQERNAALTKAMSQAMQPQL